MGFRFLCPCSSSAKLMRGGGQAFQVACVSSLSWGRRLDQVSPLRAHVAPWVPHRRSHCLPVVQDILRGCLSRCIPGAQPFVNTLRIKITKIRYSHDLSGGRGRRVLLQRKQGCTGWKGPRCPSADERINKTCSIHTTEYYSALKGKDIPTQATTQTDLETLWDVK